jgi:hypothetical protein
MKVREGKWRNTNRPNCADKIQNLTQNIQSRANRRRIFRIHRSALQNEAVQLPAQPRVRLKAQLRHCSRMLLLVSMFEFINSSSLAGGSRAQDFYIRPIQCCASHPLVAMFAPKEPEYVCSYDLKHPKYSSDDRVTCAQRYRSYLSETNAALFEHISKLCEEIPLTTSKDGATQHSSKSAPDCLFKDNHKAASPFFHPDVLRNSMSTMALRESRSSSGTVPALAVPKNEWREDVGQRYKELVPPKKRSSSHFEVTRCPSQIITRLAPSPPAAMTHEMVFMLDLDKCTLYGNDGNDLGIALQWMDRSYDDVLALYRCAPSECARTVRQSSTGSRDEVPTDLAAARRPRRSADTRARARAR